MKNFSTFLEKLREQESGISKELVNWYIQNWDVPSIYYPLVESPGRVIRDWNTGAPILKKITICEYFKVIGVLDDINLNGFNNIDVIQYKSINPFGFIGYQIGEAILISTGYYIPNKVRKNIDGQEIFLDSYYVGSISTESWKNNIREIPFSFNEDDKKIISTDVNSWKGAFTGKNNVWSIDDLMVGEKQELVLLDIMKWNASILIDELNKKNISMKNILKKRWVKNKKSKIYCTLSGLLASCHLCGSYGTLELLLSDTVKFDELGTSILNYMEIYAGYDIHPELFQF